MRFQFKRQSARSSRRRRRRKRRPERVRYKLERERKKRALDTFTSASRVTASALLSSSSSSFAPPMTTSEEKGSFTRTKTRDQLTSALARVSLLLVGCALFSFARNGETLNYKIRKKERHVVFVFQNDTPALLLFSRSRRQTDDDEGNRESEREE